jgi:Na+/H+-dicarboxylate symporter
MPITGPLKAAYFLYGRRSLGAEILLLMGVGILAGALFGERAQRLQPLGDLFIRLLMMGAVPLVFFNLLAGLTSLTDLRLLGRIAAKIMVYYTGTTIMALALGLAVMHLLRPGAGMRLSTEVTDDFGRVPDLATVFLDLVPENIFAAFASGKISQVVVFSLFLGVSTLLLPGEQRELLSRAYSLLADVIRRLVSIVLLFAPIGIGALAASTVGTYGSKIFGPLVLFILGIWLAHLAMIGTYMILLLLFSRLSPIEFLKRTGPLFATATATCSSLASLVVSLDLAERRFKLPKSIFTFTLPLGAQLNKDGTSIMLTGVLLFTAQAAGVEFDLASQITIILVGLVLSEGSGGIPGGGLVIAFIFVEAFSLPVEIAAVVGGIFRLIEMGNTTVNCLGDMVGTVIVAHSETGYVNGKSTEPTND